MPKNPKALDPTVENVLDVIRKSGPGVGMRDIAEALGHDPLPDNVLYMLRGTLGTLSHDPRVFKDENKVWHWVGDEVQLVEPVVLQADNCDAIIPGLHPIENGVTDVAPSMQLLAAPGIIMADPLSFSSVLVFAGSDPHVNSSTWHFVYGGDEYHLLVSQNAPEYKHFREHGPYIKIVWLHKGGKYSYCIYKLINNNLLFVRLK